ncbi:MAG: hypothetical protein HW421_1146 [Ignavibacteria bacterium]|nr:hypothetical protein [Ignavibacteria bacterium]
MRIIDLKEVDTSEKVEIGFIPNPNNPDKFEEWKGFKSYFDTLNKENMYLGTIDPEQDPEYNGSYIRRLAIEKGATFKDNDLVVIQFDGEYWLKRFKTQMDKIGIEYVTEIEQPNITDYDNKYHFGVVRLIEKVKIEKN